MEFRLLGPVEVWASGRQVTLTGPLQRALVAALALHPNRTMASERLIEVLWDSAVSTRAVRNLQQQVSRLRQTLDGVGHADRLVFRPPGYQLRVEPDELDVATFMRLADEGWEQLAAGALAPAGQALDAALALWRGRALEDAQRPELRREAARLEERRLAALEDRIEVRLRLDRHAELVAELEAVATQHPLRERLHGQLMLALYRSDRKADALAVYRALRRRLVEELAIEPGASLQELERRMLNADPALDRSERPAGTPPPDGAIRPGRAAVPAAVPAQLPADIASFTGRADQVACACDLLTRRHATAPALMVIAGGAGVGKSALAIHAVGACRTAAAAGAGQRPQRCAGPAAAAGQSHLWRARDRPPVAD